MNPLMVNAVGGSTIHYGAQWMRLLPSDFRVRTLDGVADDWPLSYDDLRPYYERPRSTLGVGPCRRPGLPAGCGPAPAAAPDRQGRSEGRARA